MDREENGFIRGASLLLFRAIYARVLFMCFFSNTSFSYRPGLEAAGMGLCLAAQVVLSVFLAGKSQDRSTTALLALTVLLVCLVNLYSLAHLRPADINDLGTVCGAAAEYAANGRSRTFISKYEWYFRHYHNNTGLFFLLAGLAKLGLSAGAGRDPFYLFAFAGTLLTALGIVLGYRYCAEKYSRAGAVSFLVLCLSFLPVYFIGCVPYTDTFTIWVPVRIIYISHRISVSEGKVAKLVLRAILGLTAAFGIIIKANSVIALVAVGISALFSDRNGLIGRTLAAVLTAALVLMSFSHLKYSVFDRASYDREGMPLTHWIMMGLQGDGSYSPYDEWEITTGGTHAEKVARNVEEIKGRLSRMGPEGYLELLKRKTSRSFGCGSGEIERSVLYSGFEEPDNVVYEVITTRGRFFSVYNNLSQGAYLAFLALAVLGALTGIRNRDVSGVPYLTMAGFWMFMMLWESNHRQLVNHWFILMICRAAGLSRVVKAAGRE